MTTGKIAYVSKTSDGWITVIAGGGNRIPLPYGLKVRLIDSKGGVDSIEILEGANKGVTAISHQKPGGRSHFEAGIAHRPGAKILFDLKTQSLRFNNHGPYNAFSGAYGTHTPISPGTYQLAIPAYPSNKTRTQYGQWTPFHKSWFRIGASTSDRFLHCGEISEGCVTVRQFLFDPAAPLKPGFQDLPSLLQKYPGFIGFPMPTRSAPVISWTKIYEYLILSRLDDQSVGILVVT